MTRAAASALLLTVMTGGAYAGPPHDPKISALVSTGDRESLRALGPEVMPALVGLYRSGDTERRADIANLFYWLGWKSEEAGRAMLEDAQTDDRRLRVAVQWALGRVSDDDAVVDTLLATMTRDPDPLFRDKAACGLASDQIHLTGAQKLRLYERLIDLLESPNPETRDLAIRVLQAHTGQVKGFRHWFPAEQRAKSVERWRQWLDDYHAAS